MDLEKINQIITVIIVVIFIGQLIYGYSMGFVRLASYYVKVIASFMFAPLAAPLVYTLLIKYHFEDTVRNLIVTYCDAYGFSRSPGALDALNDILREGVSNHVVDGYLREQAYAITNNIMKLCSYGGGFIIIRLIVGVFFRSVDLAAGMPIISSFNRLIGMAAAGALAFIYMELILALLSMLSFLPGVSNIYTFLMDIEVIQWLYSINPFSFYMQSMDGIENIIKSILKKIETGIQ